MITLLFELNPRHYRMDSRYNGQDVMRCTLCESTDTSTYCSVCYKHLCKDCVGKHFSDKSKVHKKKDITKFLASKTELVQKDLQELEKSIYPRYQEVFSNLQIQRLNLDKVSQELTAALNEQGEVWHKEIDAIKQSMQSEVDRMAFENMAAMDEQGHQIKNAISEIAEVIQDLKSLLNTNDVCRFFQYKSRNEAFRKLPPKIKVSYPNFQPQMIDRENLTRQFGSLSPLSIETEEQDFTLDTPQIITEITTGHKPLCNVSCQSDEEIWTSGSENVLKLYNLRGKLERSVLTKSGNEPQDLAVTRSGDLVYTDYNDSSINIEKDKQIRLPKLLARKPVTQIALRGWRPRGVCSTSSGDLLVTMESNEGNETKVVRFSRSSYSEKQSIQWDDQGQPLYSPGGSNNYKYLSENRNLDICVADHAACAVVVVSAAGKPRFKYTGPIASSSRSFKPAGITTDSKSRILTTDHDNRHIHMIDQDGHFLRHIVVCGLSRPWGLCVDSRDNIFVTDWESGNVKKIQYYRSTDCS